MNKSLKITFDCLLTIASKIYGAVIWSRNKFFDWGLLKQNEFDIPVVVVGNISVGGTGKTPHTEYIISRLSTEYNIGVVSRGYKRNTKGFILATNNSKPDDIGDEPYQIYRKFFGGIKLAVCEDRCVGINELRKIYPDINLILLDDAFQHRYVKADISIVMMEYSNLPYKDKLLPRGRLRESIDSLRRATMVIVSKCPADMKQLDFRLIKNELDLFPSQYLFFSQYQYSNLVSVFPEFSKYMPYLEWLTEEDSILAISGIANPRPFTKFLRTYKANVKGIHFSDHHQFDKDDLDFILNKFNALSGTKKLIITTEKDAVRMSNNPYFPQELKSFVYYLPISVDFVQFHNEIFENALQKEIKDAISNKNKSASN
ncbi:MAG: tetraacyldisaccharide 4'-kinase [Muribaculaceae bacterium]|nr:tetraacyldisaccharide 4'-kinase [Muribaculaceae bacterium]